MSISFEPGHPDLRGSLAVHIETERLHLQSVSEMTEECVSSYFEVFKDFPIWGFNTNRSHFQTWLKGCREVWEEGNPFGAFRVDLKEQEQIIGSIKCNPSGYAGFTEISYSLKPNVQKQGYGKEMVQVVVDNYLPTLKQKGYKITSGCDSSWGEHPLEGVEALITPSSHPASRHILMKLGFQPTLNSVFFDYYHKVLD